MVPIVLFWSLATSVALVAGIGIGVVISKKVGYNKARNAYYRRMEKKGRKERGAVMSSTRSKSLSQYQIKKCVKHSITPRYKLGNHRLKTVNNYFTKRQTKQERKYSQVMGKLDLLKVNKEIAEKTGNLNASRKYERKIRKLQGVKSNIETKNLLILFRLLNII